MKINRIKDLRKDADLTQAEMAKKLHIQTTVYARYERAERNIPLQFALDFASYFNVSLDYLCGIIDTPEPLWRGSKPPKITPKPSDDEKIVDAYHRAPDKIKTAIKALLEI